MSRPARSSNPLPSLAYRVATRAWRTANAFCPRKRAWPLEPIGLHEARHTFASLMIAAGANVKALASYMGHSSVTITLNRYGHLMPGNEDQAPSDWTPI